MGRTSGEHVPTPPSVSGAKGVEPVPQDLSDLANSALPDNASPLAGYDFPASVVLWLAGEFGRRRGGDEPVVQTSSLFEAVVEAVPFLTGKSEALASVYRIAVRADNPTSPYHSMRQASGSLALGSFHSAVGDSIESLSANAQAAVAAAGSIAAEVSRSSSVAVRHILAGLLVEPDGSVRTRVNQILQEFEVDVGGLRYHLARVIEEQYPDDDQAKWRTLLIGAVGTQIATLQPDSIPKNDPRPFDRLDLRRYAEAMGALIAADRQQAPLSIAVFGPWGSGKSFFMNMINAATDEYSRSKEKAPDGSTIFKERVVPIWFNAWHYVEGNLWASLVYTILEELRKTLQPQSEGKHPFQEALEKLGIREAARMEAEEKLNLAKTRQAEAQAALDQAEQAAKNKRVEKEKAVLDAATVLTQIRGMAIEAFRPPDDTNSQVWIASVGDSVRKAADYLGRPELANRVPKLRDAALDIADLNDALAVQVGAVEELLSEVHTTSLRGASVLGWLANAKFERGDWMRLATWAMALIALLIGVTLILQHYAEEVAASISAVVATIVPILGSIGLALGWAKRHMGSATKAFAVLGALRERVEQQKTRSFSEADATLAAARRATDEADAEVQRRTSERDAAQAAVAQATADLSSATTAARMLSFVSQRLADGEYQRHLGLTYTVRTDMSRLGENSESVHPSEEKAKAPTPVQRMVLYIDDLDRCPPKRVVEVLEAVHLLLAFPLFIVVVGVDIRWVSQALHQRYPTQLGGQQGSASPLDYLEKVFQVPFWLPAMDGITGRRLLDLTVPPAATSTEQKAGPPPGIPSERNGSTQDRPHPAGKADNTQTRLSPAVPTPGMTAKQAAEALTLAPKERDRLLTMATALGVSPRRAKRFVNLYQLLKASLSPEERIQFVTADGAAGSHIGAMILLAATTGAPQAARKLVARLGERDSDLEATLKSILTTKKTDAFPDELAAYEATVELIEKASQKAGFADHLQFWASRIQRFGFHQH